MPSTHEKLESLKFDISDAVIKIGEDLKKPYMADPSSQLFLANSLIRTAEQLKRVVETQAMFDKYNNV